MIHRCTHPIWLFLFLFNIVYASPYDDVQHVMPYRDHGWFSPYVKDALTTIFTNREVQIVIELGAWMGQSTAFFAEAVGPHGKVYTVDHWKGSLEERDCYSSYIPTLYTQFLSNMIHLNLTENVVPIHASTSEGVHLLKDIFADLIFIDASKDAHEVYRDLSLYIDHVRPGGCICGPAWSFGEVFPNGLHSVGYAVEKFCREHGLRYETDGWFWVIYIS